MVLALDSEYEVALQGFEQPALPKFNNVREFVNCIDELMATDFSRLPPLEHIRRSRIAFQSFDGQQIHLRRFVSDEIVNQGAAQSAVLYAHGGGMVAASVDIYAPYIAYLADLTQLPIFAIEYRLATEETAGSARSTYDVFHGLKHLSENAAQWNVDPSRIIIMGDSGGGGLAAGAALLARDRGLNPPLAKQVLVYPMLDDRTKLAEDSLLKPFLLFGEEENRLCWQTVLGRDKAGREDAKVSVHAAPGRAKDLKGLPRTFIDVGGLDLFLEEDLSYAARLLACGVEVELHVWPGLPHGFELAKDMSWTKKAFEARVSALKRV